MQVILKNIETVVLRFDSGEDVVGELQKFCQQNDVKGAWVSGLGSSSEAVVSFYNLETRQYEDHDLNERLEVTNLTGNIAILDNQKFIHLHGTFGDQQLNTKAGHVKKLVVSATCEVLLTIFPESLKRKLDEKTGLKLLDIE